MARGHRRTRAAALFVLALLAVSRQAAPQPPVPESIDEIIVDGDLTDLIGVIRGRGIDAFISEYPAVPAGLAGVRRCPPYVNGFDLDGVYALFEYRNADGTIRRDAAGRPDVTLHVGWRVRGQIGDVDGDGDPVNATIARPDCYSVTTGDPPSVEPAEFYSITLELGCPGSAYDPPQAIAFGVVATTAVPVGQLVMHPNTPGQTPLPQVFAFQNSAALGDPTKGHALEARIDHLQTYLPPGTDFSRVTLEYAAGASSDALIDDAVRPGFVFAPPPTVAVTQTLAEPTGDPGAPVERTITVRNQGLCRLRDLTVIDDLDLALTYVRDDRGSTGSARTRTWSFASDTLAPGDSLVIRLQALVGGSGATPRVDRIEVHAASACDSAAMQQEVPEPSALEMLPTEFAMHSNMPNPFSERTTLRFALPEASHVTLAVYSVAGQQVAVLADRRFPAGVHPLEWQAVNRSGHRLAAGVYYFRLKAVGVASGRRFTRSMGMVIMR